MDPKVLYPAIGIGSVVAIGIAYLFLKGNPSSYPSPATGARYEFTTDRLAPAESGPRGSHEPQYPRDSVSTVYESARGSTTSNASVAGGKKTKRRKRSLKKCSKRVWH
jgi:hypothetical protein